MNGAILQQALGVGNDLREGNFTGAAVIATVALYARQSLLVVYILLGMLFGPSGLSFVNDPRIIQEISQIGIVFLLFLLGVNLPATKFLQLLKETTLVTGVSALLLIATGFVVGMLFGYTSTESMIIGTALMFSSTIIGIKLLPTTVLHHRRRGEVIVSILLLQDFLAIIVLIVMLPGNGGSAWISSMLLIVKLAAIVVLAIALHRFVLYRLIARFDKIHEYVFLITIGWCLGIAELAEVIGLSYEIGAFIAGIALATNPISQYIAEVLKPLRDFFLILFFFSIGATLELRTLENIIVPAIILATIVISVKPVIYKFLLSKSGEANEEAAEIGIRLGQASEFSLLIAVLAYQSHLISQTASYLIQLSTILTFFVSSYLIVMRYPTPISLSDKLRRD